MSHNTDFAITLVNNEAEATVLNAHDLQYVHNQLCSDKKIKLRAEREFPNHVNKRSTESLDRCFSEIPVQHGKETKHKLVFWSAKQADEICRGEREFAHVLWEKVAPVEEFAG